MNLSEQKKQEWEKTLRELQLMEENDVIEDFIPSHRNSGHSR